MRHNGDSLLILLILINIHEVHIFKTCYELLIRELP